MAAIESVPANSNLNARIRARGPVARRASNSAHTFSMTEVLVRSAPLHLDECRCVNRVGFNLAEANHPISFSN
jgi:hypothetical protein